MRLGIYATAVALTVSLLAGTSMASISGSKHDFGSLSWSGNQICQPCHTPHNATLKDANGATLDGPLWNHTLSSATYTMLADGTTGDVDQNSKLCLSCHDGTVALDSFGGTTGNTMLTGKANFGTDLSNDHPIGSNAIWPTGVSYMVDPALRSAAGIMPLRSMADGRQAVGCTSCHEPHNRKNTPHMTWVANNVAGSTVDGRAVSGSLLCMNCHKK